MIVYSLFDYTGRMVEPWADAGATCICIDTQHEATELPRALVPGTIYKVNKDVRGLSRYSLNWPKPDIVFGFPPCTDLASSGARWFKGKLAADSQCQVNAVKLARTVERFGEHHGVPWFVENPRGRLSTLWRKPDHSFDPWQFTGFELWDNYTKQTFLWAGGEFVMPPPFVHEKVQRAVDAIVALYGRVLPKPKVLEALPHGATRNGMIKWYPDDRIHKAPPGADRANFRSATPRGFAKAVFLANYDKLRTRGA